MIATTCPYLFIRCPHENDAAWFVLRTGMLLRPCFCVFHLKKVCSQREFRNRHQVHFEPTIPDSKSGVLTTTLWELLKIRKKAQIELQHTEMAYYFSRQISKIQNSESFKKRMLKYVWECWNKVKKNRKNGRKHCIGCLHATMRWRINKCHVSNCL